MEVSEHTLALQAALPTEPIVGVSHVAENMLDIRRHLGPAGFPQFEPFAFSYHAVTADIEDRLNAEKIYGQQHYKQPQVLHTATGNFEKEWTDNIANQLAGKRVNGPWGILMNNELIHLVDKGTKAIVGYNAHIIKDLGVTVFKTSISGMFSPEVMQDYIKNDYPKINEALTDTSRNIAPLLVDIENTKIRNAVVKIAMGGIVVARKQALRDFHKLSRAQSEDELLSIQYDSEKRGEKLGNLILTSSYNAQKVLRRYPGQKDHTVIDLAA